MHSRSTRLQRTGTRLILKSHKACVRRLAATRWHSRVHTRGARDAAATAVGDAAVPAASPVEQKGAARAELIPELDLRTCDGWCQAFSAPVAAWLCNRETLVTFARTGSSKVHAYRKAQHTAGLYLAAARWKEHAMSARMRYERRAGYER